MAIRKLGAVQASSCDAKWIGLLLPRRAAKHTCDLAFEFGRLIPSTVEGIHRHPRGMNLNLALLESKPVIIKYNSTTTTACTTYNH